MIEYRSAILSVEIADLFFCTKTVIWGIIIGRYWEVKEGGVGKWQKG
jgi:hypothetical protein